MAQEDIKYPKVESYCNEMHHIGKQLQNKFDDINNLANTLINKEYWSAPAAEIYGNEIKNVVNKFSSIHNELENCIIYMAKVSGIYQNLDKKLVTEMHSIIGEANSTIFPNGEV